MDRLQTVVAVVTFSLLQITVSLKCPSNICTCRDKEIASRMVTEVRCNTGDNKGYVPVFRTVRQSISSLDLSRIELTTLGNQTFRQLATVRELYLNDNYLIRIETRAFAKIESTIELLDLQHNRLRNLHFLTTHDFSRLRELLLRDNLLEEIRPESLTFMPSLESLNLDDNSLSGPLTFLRQPSLKALADLNLDANRFTEIDPEDFLYLTNLRSLLVNRNQLRNISFLSHKIFGQLQGISAANNQLGDIDATIFDDKTLMKWIDLSDNKVTNASFLSSCSLKRLEEIYLSSNLLTSLPDNSFQATKYLSIFVIDNNLLQLLPRCALSRFYERLQTFDISKNPMHCDCNMSWLQDPHVISTEKQSECVNLEFLSTNTYDITSCTRLPQCVALDECTESLAANPLYGNIVTSVLQQEHTIGASSTLELNVVLIYLMIAAMMSTHL